jgi:hypothetical protein
MHVCRRSISWIVAAGLLSAVVLGTGASSNAYADEFDKKTIVTISAPVEIPGKVLPAGTYVFKRLDSPSDQNIVQIFDKDETHLIATVLAIPDYRDNPTDKPLIAFEERPSGTPEAIKAIFYPGDNYGWQFVYPHERAVQLAKNHKQNVLSMRDDMKNDAAQMRKAEVNGVSPEGGPVDVNSVVTKKPK